MALMAMMVFVPTAIVVTAAFVIFIVLMAQIHKFIKTKKIIK